MSLLVFGTIALDDVKTPLGVRKDMLGGSGAHFCMSASLFTDVHLVGVVGSDFPERHIELLKKKKVNVGSVEIFEGKTFHWEGEYKEDDLNSALTRATELGVLTAYAPRITAAQKNIPNVFLANYDPDVQMKLLRLSRNPKLVGLDSMNLWIMHQKKSLLKLVKKVNLFILNDGEAKMLTGEHNLIKAAKALRKLGPELIIVKKGEQGVLFYCDKFMFAFPAYPVEKVVDPTGAGDTFAGGIMGYLARAKRVNETALRKAALYATTLSSFNVEGFGASKMFALTLADVNKRMRRLTKFIAAV